MLWPDLASAHYSRGTVSWMQENFYFENYDSDLPNIPKARLIENFCGFLTQKVYEGGWHSTTEKQLINLIQSQLKKIEINFLQTLEGGIKTKLRTIADGGALATNKK